MKSAMLLAAGAVIAIGVGSARAADAPFYAGKVITFITGTASGGGSDIMCRQIAQDMPAHIAGNPTIIVKSMPSSDNILASNYVGISAKKDGLTFRCGGFGLATQLSHDPGLKVDFTKFQYILGDGTSEVMFMRADTAPGLKTGQDFFKVAQKDILLGGTAVDGIKDVAERNLLEVLGLNDFRYITGFPGEGGVRAGLQQKFINLEGDNSISYLNITEPTLVRPGIVVPLFQAGALDAQGHLTQRTSQIPDIPSFYEFYQTHFGKKPSGLGWDMAEAMFAMQDSAIYALALPPGSPPEAVAAMRAAVGPLNLDPEYKSAIEKLRGPGAVESDGATVAKSLDDFLNMKPELAARYTQLIADGQRMSQSRK